MIKLLDDLLIAATCNPNVPGAIVAGLRQALDEARAALPSPTAAPVELPPPFDSLEEAQRAAGIVSPLQFDAQPIDRAMGVAQPYRVCIKAHETNVGNTVPVGHVVTLEGCELLQQPACWLPCDKDGWIDCTEHPAPALLVRHELSEGGFRWRPLPPKPSALDALPAWPRRDKEGRVYDLPHQATSHRVCLRDQPGATVGSVIDLTMCEPPVSPEHWAPCDAAGWVSEHDRVAPSDVVCEWNTAAMWRPVCPPDQPSALDEMAEQVARWAVPTREEVAKSHAEMWEHIAAAVAVDPSDTVTAVLSERGKRYGKFADHARITQSLKEVMRACPKWAGLAPHQKEALEMIAHKIGRILNGDPDYDDSWVDVAGYSKLVADELQGVSR